MTEAEFQSILITNAQIEGFVAIKLDPGTGTIPKGWPDLVILQPDGYTLWVEVKAAGGRVAPQQRRHMLLLASAGHHACFVDPRPDYCCPVPMTYRELETYEPPRRP